MTARQILRAAAATAVLVSCTSQTDREIRALLGEGEKVSRIRTLDVQTDFCEYLHEYKEASPD